jgi:hypothetical protein
MPRETTRTVKSESTILSSTRASGCSQPSATALAALRLTSVSARGHGLADEGHCRVVLRAETRRPMTVTSQLSSATRPLCSGSAGSNRPAALKRAHRRGAGAAYAQRR